MPNISKTEYTGRVVMTAVVGFAAVWGIAHNLPFSAVTPADQAIIGVFRVLYGALIFLRLLRVQPAAPMVLGWRRTKGVQNAIFWWMIPAVLICVGFLTPVAVLAHLLFGSVLWRRSKVYSLEDVLIRSAGFCLLFLNSHLSVSIDAQLGLDYGLSEPSVIGLNLYAWTYGLLMLSAGGEKLCSPMWRRGLGFFYFMSLRHWVKPAFQWANKSLVASAILSWVTIVTQFVLVLSLLVPEVRVVALPMSVGFALMLCLTVYLAFLSHQTLLSSTFLLAIEISRRMADTTGPAPGSATAVTPLLLVAIGFLVLGAVSSSGLVKLRGGWVTTLSAWTIALRPIMIFVETHIYGIYIFRQIAKLGDRRKSVLECWDENAVPSRLQPWRPRTIAGTTYRVTDYCIAALEDLPERAASRAESIVDLAYGGYLELSEEERAKLEHIEFEVRVFDPEDGFVPDTSHWLSPKWQSIGVVRGFPHAPRFERGDMPPRYKKTFRWPVQFA